jgi:hypothetical protein
MDPAYISAISALAGSVIGGLTTGFTTLVSQRSQARAGMVAHDLARREDLVRDFIIAASKTYGDALSNNEPKMPEIVDLYAMVNRLRVLGMSKTDSVRGHCHAHDRRHLFHPQSDRRRSQGVGENRSGHRSLEGLQRGGARGTASVRIALMRRRPIPLEAPSSRSTRGSEDTDLYVRARDEFRARRLDLG